jgi:hypothetical protein
MTTSTTSFREYTIEGEKEKSPRFYETCHWFRTWLEECPNQKFHAARLAEIYNRDMRAKLGLEHKDLKPSSVGTYFRHLRHLGLPICSDNEGYCWSTKKEDLMRTYNHLIYRARAIDAVAAKIGERLTPAERSQALQLGEF